MKYVLKPCPFCGCNKVEYYKNHGPVYEYEETKISLYAVYCPKCSANIRIRRMYCESERSEAEYMKEVIDAWNHREGSKT